MGLSTVNWKNGSDQFKEGTEEYYQNKLIRDYITLLIDPKSQHILHRSIDKDTKLLKDVLAEIESKRSPMDSIPCLLRPNVKMIILLVKLVLVHLH